MERRMIQTLLVDDNDLECKCENLKLRDIDLGRLGFVNADLEKFDMIIYKGSKGTKIIKSKYTQTGKIGD
jgi:hypothetical protein